MAITNTLPTEARTIFDANSLDYSFCDVKEQLARFPPFAAADVIWDDGKDLYLVNVARCLAEYSRFRHGIPVMMAKIYRKEPASFMVRHSFRAPASASDQPLSVEVVETPEELARSFENATPDLLLGWLKHRRQAIFGPAGSKPKTPFAFFAERIRVEVKGVENRPELLVVSLAPGDWEDAS